MTAVEQMAVGETVLARTGGEVFVVDTVLTVPVHPSPSSETEATAGRLVVVGTLAGPVLPGSFSTVPCDLLYNAAESLPLLIEFPSKFVDGSEYWHLSNKEERSRNSSSKAMLWSNSVSCMVTLFLLFESVTVEEEGEDKDEHTEDIMEEVAEALLNEVDNEALVEGVVSGDEKVHLVVELLCCVEELIHET